jgi:F-type H+-transporting ATPase subunit delta
MSLFAPRYARALAEIVTDPKAGLDASAIDTQLNDFLAAWTESADLREIFSDPSIPPAKKVAIIDKLASRLELSKTVRNFLAVLVNHERIEAFPEVLTEYRREIRIRLGIAQVEFTTARPLDEPERQAVVQRIGELAGAEVEATFFQDPSLLGGALLKIGSTVYDGSLRGRLEQLKEKLATS